MTTPALTGSMDRPRDPRDLCDYNSFFYDCRDFPCADCPSREEHLEFEDPTDFIDDEEALEEQA